MSQPGDLSATQRWLARLHIPAGLRGQLGWSTSSYVAVQFMRFATNVVLTRILAPELFGIMIVLTSIRVGIELFTDIGLGHNIIANKNAFEPRFYNTAWTLQILRGVLLAVIALALMPALSHFYDEKSLSQVLPLISVLFLVTGGHSIGTSLAVKVLNTKRTAQFEVSTAGLGSAASVALALAMPNIWGLIGGNFASTLVTAIGTYFVFPGLRYRLMIDREYAWAMIGFGKWIFLSSIVFFLATNYDRLVLGKYVSLAVLGVYGVARSLSDIFAQFATRLGNTIVFPSIAMTDLRGPELQAKLTGKRSQFLAAMMLGVGVFIAFSDVIIGVVYDPRYAGAAQLLPWVGLAAWVGILNTLNDSVMLGLSKPQYAAIGNVAKFAALLIALPLGVTHLGIVGAALATVVAEFARYVVLVVAQYREGVRFVRHDVLFTGGVLVGALAVRAGLFELGLSSAPLAMFALALN